MRVHDPIGGPPDLDSFFQAYGQHFQGLASYERHLQRLVAGYSRGDGPDELRSTFSFAVQKLVEADEKSRAQYGADKNILAHHGRYAALFRAALIYLTFGLCLRAPRFEIEAILRCCDRGDPLLETLARVAAPGSEARQLAPAFYRIFDRLYDALGAPSNQRPRPHSAVSECLVSGEDGGLCLQGRSSAEAAMGLCRILVLRGSWCRGSVGNRGHDAGGPPAISKRPRRLLSGAEYLMIAPQEFPGRRRFVLFLSVGHILGRRGKTGPSPMRMRAEPLILRVFRTTGGRGVRPKTAK